MMRCLSATIAVCARVSPFVKGFGQCVIGFGRCVISKTILRTEQDLDRAVAALLCTSCRHEVHSTAGCRLSILHDRTSCYASTCSASVVLARTDSAGCYKQARHSHYAHALMPSALRHCP